MIIFDVLKFLVLVLAGLLKALQAIIKRIPRLCKLLNKIKDTGLSRQQATTKGKGGENRLQT